MRGATIRTSLGLAWLLLIVVGSALAADAPTTASQTPAAAPVAFSGKAGTFEDEKITVNGDEREYRLVVPDSVDLSKPAAIVFAFHGMGDDNKDHMALTSGLPDLAAEHKFILVFPAASTQIFSGRLVKAWALAPDHIPLDVAFFDALLAKLRTQYRIDPQAIFITGMSNGAYFAHLLGRERSEVIAAVAAHSGELGQDQLGLISTGRKFPVMIIHGTADPVFPVELARHARDVYQATGHPVTYLELPNWIHQWYSPVDEKIWDFFDSHRLRPLLTNTIPAPAPMPDSHP
jgi:polyhydroxybutyrate depolymerase